MKIGDFDFCLCWKNFISTVFLKLRRKAMASLAFLAHRRRSNRRLSASPSRSIAALSRRHFAHSARALIPFCRDFPFVVSSYGFFYLFRAAAAAATDQFARNHLFSIRYFDETIRQSRWILLRKFDFDFAEFTRALW